MIVRTGWPSELWGCGAHAASPPIPCGVQPEYEAWWTAALEQHLQFIKQRFVRAMPLDPVAVSLTPTPSPGAERPQADSEPDVAGHDARQDRPGDR